MLIKKHSYGPLVYSRSPSFRICLTFRIALLEGSEYLRYSDTSPSSHPAAVEDE